MFLRKFLTFGLLAGVFLISPSGASELDRLSEPLQYFKKYYSKDDLREIQKLNIKILTELEKKTKFPKKLRLEQVNSNWFRFPFISEANALGIKGKCFFGGWMTSQGPTWCHEPWKHTKNPVISSFGPTYNKESYCGGKDLFRCNPVIFGKPKLPKPELGRNPDRGICIKITSYNHVTRTCAKEASKYMDEFIDSLDSDSKKLEGFLTHTISILKYCEKDKLDYCGVLKAYLQKITEKAKGCKEAEVEALLPKVVPPLSKNELTKIKKELKVKASPSLEEQLKKYSNSSQTKRMIATMQTNFVKNCSDKGCTGKKSNSSTGMCWRYVKYGLMAGGYADGYLKESKLSYPYTPTASAKFAGKDFFDKKSVGFTNVFNLKVAGKKLTAKNAPKGAILVYEGGPHGHIEVKTGENEHISDFRSKWPINSYSAYNRISRKLIGIYVKLK